MNIENILVAVDFSPESDVAVEQALTIARLHGARLTLLHAGMLPERPSGTPESMRALLDQYMSVVREHLASDRERLGQLRERISGQGAEVAHMVCDGPPAAAIIQAADELKPDLIVAGSHGRTGVKRFLLGSVAERIARNGKYGTLIARPRPDNNLSLRRVLCPTDFSGASERALATALTLAGRDTVIDVLHCFHATPLAYPRYLPTQGASGQSLSLRESLMGESAKLGQELLSRHRTESNQLRFHISESPAATGIREWLAANECDLVVMGSHGWQVPMRWLLGSVAERTVRHAPCSVLVVHGGPRTE